MYFSRLYEYSKNIFVCPFSIHSCDVIVRDVCSTGKFPATLLYWIK